MRGISFVRGTAAVLVTVLGLMLGGCEQARPPDPEIDRQEIEALIRDYLPKLGQAYATGDTTILEGIAVDRELFRVKARIRELKEQGKVYEPEFKELAIETFSTWKYANAFVTTIETWDVRSYSLGAHIQLGEALEQRNHVRYQFKRKDQGWVILYRDLASAPAE